MKGKAIKKFSILERILGEEALQIIHAGNGKTLALIFDLRSFKSFESLAFLLYKRKLSQETNYAELTRTEINLVLSQKPKEKFLPCGINQFVFARLPFGIFLFISKDSCSIQPALGFISFMLRMIFAFSARSICATSSAPAHSPFHGISMRKKIAFTSPTGECIFALNSGCLRENCLLSGTFRIHLRR